MRPHQKSTNESDHQTPATMKRQGILHPHENEADQEKTSKNASSWNEIYDSRPLSDTKEYPQHPARNEDHHGQEDDRRSHGTIQYTTNVPQEEATSSNDENPSHQQRICQEHPTTTKKRTC